MIQINAMIMGHAYTLVCKEGEQATLQQAVTYLDEKCARFVTPARSRAPIALP